MKKLLLSAVVLSSIGLNAQSEAPTLKETKSVGIETSSPYATLDVNGDARLRKVELMKNTTSAEEIFQDCPCVLTIDKYGVIKRIPKSQFVITDGSTGNGQGSNNGQGNGSGGNQGGGDGSGSGTTTFTANKTVELTRQWTDSSCPEGKEGKVQTLKATGEATATSTVSQAEADEKATTLATQKANETLDQLVNEKDGANTACEWKKAVSGTAICGRDRAGKYTRFVDVMPVVRIDSGTHLVMRDDINKIQYICGLDKRELKMEGYEWVVVPYEQKMYLSPSSADLLLWQAGKIKIPGNIAVCDGWTIWEPYSENNYLYKPCED